MYKEDIILSDIETVKNFVTFANKFDFPVNLISDIQLRSFTAATG